MKIFDILYITLIAVQASNDDEIVVVCGSVFLMAEARKALGYNEPNDSDDLRAVSGVHLKTAEERLKEAAIAAVASS